MQEQLLYEYAVIRVMPRVEREEFINVGVVLYCRERKLVLVRIDTTLQRLQMFPDVDAAEVCAYLHAFAQICTGTTKASPIASLPAAERFRWLTATRSTIVQSSKVHPGFCADPAEKLDQLFNQLVS